MSLSLLLTRDLREPECTLGTLLVGTHKLHTIERGWVPNPFGGRSGARFVSCVSDGTYRLIPHRSEKYPVAWALVNRELDVYHFPQDVPAHRVAQSRQTILIHAANFWWDVTGCIGPGRMRAKVSGEWMVQSSRDAMNLLRTVIGSTLDVALTIRWGDGLQPLD
jgi:hypothetical protein